MLPVLLWEGVEACHALTVSHEALGCFWVDLLATSDKRTFLLLAFLPGGSIGHWLYSRVTGHWAQATSAG